jgi:hypothetical protein
MSKNALEIFPTWMQAYLRETVQNHKVIDEATVWIQNFTKSAFDLLKNAMAAPPVLKSRRVAELRSAFLSSRLGRATV